MVQACLKMAPSSKMAGWSEAVKFETIILVPHM